MGLLIARTIQQDIAMNWRAELRQAIVEHFGDSDIKALCFDLGVDYDELPGDTKTEKVISIIEYFSRLNQVPVLIAYCSRHRPNIPWEEIENAAVHNGLPKEPALPAVGPASVKGRGFNSLFLAGMGIVIVSLLLVVVYLVFLRDGSKDISEGVTAIASEIPSPIPGRQTPDESQSASVPMDKETPPPRVTTTTQHLVSVNTADISLPTESSPTAEVKTEVPPTTAPPTETPVPVLVPEIREFQVCLDPCNGNNSVASVPGGTEKFYLHWTYHNIPKGSRYTRTWQTYLGEWVRYDCIWQGAESGVVYTEIREPGGFLSAPWVVTIAVDGRTLLEEKVNITGNWKFWDPAGSFTACE